MSIAKKSKPEQGDDGRFPSGNIGGGRPKGSRNRLGEEFLRVLAADFEQHGQAVIERLEAARRANGVRVVEDEKEPGSVH